MHDYFAARLRQVITPIFPAGARIVGIPRQSELVFAISWRLLQNPARRSKTIRLCIADEIVDEYGTSAADAQRLTESRIESALREMLADFEPERDSLGPDDTEIVQWTLSFGGA